MYLTLGLFIMPGSEIIISATPGEPMNDLETLNQLTTTEYTPQFEILFEDDTRQSKLIRRHKEWHQTIRHERPNPSHPFKVAVYIRYFNQTKHKDYLNYHIKQFSDSIALCPKWEMVGFYIDNGSSVPKMENSPEWSRLLGDCMEGKADLIITQKISNVSKDADEIAICSRVLASQQHPVGIYFISEDIFTLASYYLDDLRDVDLINEEDLTAINTYYLNDKEL